MEKAWKEELEIRLDRKGKLTRCKEALFEVGRVKYCGAIVCITRLAGDNLSSAVATWNRELPLAIKGKNLAQLRMLLFSISRWRESIPAPPKKLGTSRNDQRDRCSQSFPRNWKRYSSFSGVATIASLPLKINYSQFRKRGGGKGADGGAWTLGCCWRTVGEGIGARGSNKKI